VSCGVPVADTELCMQCKVDRLATGLGGESPVTGAAPEAVENTQVSGERFEVKPGLVGRDAELGRLSAIIDESSERRELGFVSIVGAAGSGKTRLLTEALREARKTHPGLRLLSGSAGGAGHLPHGALVRALGQRFGVSAADSAEVAQKKLETGIGALLPDGKGLEIVHLVAHLMRVGFAQSPVVQPLIDAPAKLESRTFLALKKLLAAEAEKGPVVIAIDDLDRAGPELVNLLHYLAAGLSTLPVVIVTAARPGLEKVHPGFGTGDMPAESMVLMPLDADAQAELMGELTARIDDVPPGLVDHARTLDGAPRTLIELLRLLLDAGVLQRDHSRGVWAMDGAGLGELPHGHAEILARRVALLTAAERDLLEKASVIGEVFWLDAILALTRIEALGTADPEAPASGMHGEAEVAGAHDRTRGHLAHVMGKLIEREWLIEQAGGIRAASIPGERELHFAYPPLQSVIYDAMDDARRRRAHGLAAEWLELRPEGRGEEAQEEIGRHLERAGMGSAAAVRYRRAADAARARFENAKAIRLYTLALDCAGDGELAARIHIWHDLGSVYELKGDFAAALDAFDRMLRLSWLAAARSKAAVAFNKMGRVWRRKGDLAQAHEQLSRGRDLFAETGDQRGYAASLDDLGQVFQLEGHYDEAFEHFTRALALRSRVGDQRSIAHSLSNLGILQKNRGRFPEAENCHREALQLRRAIGDRAGAILSLNNLAVLAYHHGDVLGARRGWEQALTEAEEIGALPLQALALANLGELALSGKKLDEARRRLSDAIGLAQKLDDRRLLSEATRNLSLLELESGNTQTARTLARQAHELAEGSGLHDYVARALLALGAVHGATIFDDVESTGEHLLGSGSQPGDEPVPTPSESRPRAERYFERGIELFRGVGNEGELARGLERYGRFKLERGDVPGGRVLLEEAAAIFGRLGMKAGEDVQKVISDLGA
jgi:tetratricopeptide (TPR) repeat protein